LLQQYMEPQKVSQNHLARAIKVPPRRINEIVHEKRAITADTAVRLAIYFGSSATYWLHLQSEYDIGKIKDRIKIQLSTTQASPPKNNSKNNNIQEKTKPNNSAKKRIMR
jgi:antitoxin HigA-1